MPRVKIDYIVSFSSEDPENPANNLLAWEVNKKKWLCNKGEPSCSVVLQLTKAVQICSVHVGAHHAALVEVLVGRSEKPNNPFEVLVPSCVLLPPAEARRPTPVERVRTFGAEALAAAAAQRWDRVRLVCSQPYNKHCQYGLSFVHIFSPEGEASAASPEAPAPSPALPARLLSLDTFSSDEEEFRPGDLFAQHLRKPTDDTGAQIRQASSQALKNIPDSSVKLTKTSITKQPHTKRTSPGTDSRVGSGRRGGRDTGGDDRRDGADRAGRHDDEGDEGTTTHEDEPSGDSARKTDDGRKDDKLKTPKPRDEPTSSRRQRDEATSSRRDGPAGRSPNTESKKDGETRKRPHTDRKHGALLADVVFVLSGYENPLRAQLRAAALALGAACQPAWGPRCTHLICAFPNTPKLRSVRAAPGGAAVAVARGEWLLETARRRRRLPWQWFATEPARLVAPPPAGDRDEECDTDDEIEKVRQKMKKQCTDRTPPRAPASPPRSSPPASPPPADVSGASSDVTFVRDERVQGSTIALSDTSASTDEEAGGASTDEEAGGASTDEEACPRAALPDFFRGRTFAVRAAPAARLARYVRAYGGLVLDDESCDVDYVLCDARGAGAGAGRAGRGRRVSGAWVWRCHAAGRLLPLDGYLRG